MIQDFNDASVFSVFLDLNAAVADNLHYNIDRSIQETVLQYAQQRSSIYNIARTYGLKLPGQRPSVSLVDFSVTVPALVIKKMKDILEHYLEVPKLLVRVLYLKIFMTLILHHHIMLKVFQID